MTTEVLQHILNKFTPAPLPQDSKWKPEELPAFLSQFKLNDALRLIGEQSKQNLFSDGTISPEQFDGILSGISMLLIEYSTDTKSLVMTADDLRLAASLFIDMPEKFETDDDLKSYAFRQIMLQYYYQINPSNLFSRTILIFGELWDNNQVASTFAIKSAVISAQD